MNRRRLMALLWWLGLLSACRSPFEVVCPTRTTKWIVGTDTLTIRAEGPCHAVKR